MIREECPFCGQKKNKKIFERDFRGYCSVAPFEKYDILLCDNCGLFYAGNIVQAKSMSDYYDRMSKYENDNYGFRAEQIEFYKEQMQIIKKHIPKDARILDVGCGAGGLLSILKQEGYHNLTGIEPSERNCENIRRSLEITALHAFWGREVPEIENEKFDIIIFSGVLEHLLNFWHDMRLCRQYLKEGGFVYLSVPDVELFPRYNDLYQQFSVEHVNYFDIEFLDLMMSKDGYKLVEFERSDTDALMGIWRISDSGQDERGEMIKGFHGTACMKIKQYLEQCHKMELDMKAKMSLFHCGNGYYIWGAGTLLAMMIQQGIVNLSYVKGIADSNLNFQGLEIYGQRIISPERLLNMENMPILIASQRAFHSIERNIRQLGLTNEIIDLFS